MEKRKKNKLNRHTIFRNKHIKRILKFYKDLWALESATSLLGWDMETYMPPSSFSARAIVLSKLQLFYTKLIKNKQFREEVKKAKAHKDLTIYEKAILRILEKEFKYYDALPESFIEEWKKTTTKAFGAWTVARKKNSFGYFYPHLRKVVELSIKKAEHLGYEKHPYNALLDLYEDGLTISYLNKFFAPLRRKLPRLIDKIISKSIFPQHHELENTPYDIEKMKQLNYKILRLFKFPFQRARLDISEHPFTTTISLNDVRITTRYRGVSFKESLFSVIHEFGHALYELNLPTAFEFTPLASDLSLGIHESQSRFWENLIGRSKAFSYSNYSLMSNYLKFLKKYSPQELYLYFNTVKRSLIRTEADEVTYNMHILLRYEIERSLIEGKIQVKEVKEVWNEKMEKYLHVVPTTDKEGVLQDVHWSIGSIGYFPTYSIGTVFAVDLYNKASKKFDITSAILNKNYESISQWLKETVHIYGGLYQPQQLIKKILKRELDSNTFIDYIKRKYLEENF